MASEYIIDLKNTKRLQTAGTKAGNLCFLARKGFLVPRTYVCVWDAYARYRDGEAQILEALERELRAKLDPGKRYAVRSSANVEDGVNSSFAGQFKSVLDVQGIGAILQAIRSVWASTTSPSLQSYTDGHGSDGRKLQMAVLIQEMVLPQVSGVAFSKNPVTAMDEVVVEAVRGSGEALVQEGVTPSRWINKWGTWLAQPEDLRLGETIELELIERIVRETKQIAKTYGRAVDLEWVYDGQAVHWVQLREITALDLPLYSNRISKEMFPGIIKPLIWSVNVPLVNGVWMSMFTELIGQNDLDPQDLVGYFYCRAYLNMGALGQILDLLGLPRETLELMMGIEVEGAERPSFRPSPKTYSLLPRMLRFAWDKVKIAPRIEAFLPTMEAQLQAFRRQEFLGLDERQILDEIDRLYLLVQETVYYNIVAPVLMQIHHRILKGQLARLGVDFGDFDLTGGMVELERFDPNVHLARLNQRFGELDPDLQARTRESAYHQLPGLPGAEPLYHDIAKFLERFGHFSDSGNDFSHEPWREKPDLVLKMVADYAVPEGGNGTKISVEDLQLPVWRRPFFRWVYNNSRRFRRYREAVSSLYTFGYGLFRDSFLALGERLVQRGFLSQRDDIFYLYLDEVRQLVEKGRIESDCQALIRARMAEAEQARAIVPPDTIYGTEAPPVDLSQGSGLKGIPTSRGHYTGAVKVLTGLQDFDKLQEGDVLVIPYSDVGWTPLFAKAGAVVAESGGILSHSSIVAREYGIPAVVSVSGACQLEDGARVTVDGYRGEIVVHDSITST